MEMSISKGVKITLQFSLSRTIASVIMHATNEAYFPQNIPNRISLHQKSFTLHPGYGDLLIAWAHYFGSKVKQAMENGGPIGRCHSLWSPRDSVNKREEQAGPPLSIVPSLDI